MISLILVLPMVLLAQGSSLGRVDSNPLDVAGEFINWTSPVVVEADESSLDLAEGNGEARIIGGRVAASRLIYQASLRLNLHHICGGSIINAKWILTAAHCLSGFTKKDLIAVIGSNKLSSGGERRGCADLKVHPNYNRGTIRHDIGGFKVDKDMQFTKTIGTIPLATQNPAVGQLTYVSGWGYDTYPKIHVPNDLKELVQKIIKFSTCKAALKSRVPQANSMVEGDQLCAMSDLKKGHGACKGDSGSPMVILGTKGAPTTQIGVTSFGDPCANGYSDVYTSVANYRGWIDKNLK